MPEIGQTAVTLKTNRTSVMLYASHYVRLPEGVGASVQAYLGSFPVSATEVPARFAALLREATLGRPERYQELMRRINDKVLVPARATRTRGGGTAAGGGCAGTRLGDAGAAGAARDGEL